MANDIARKLRKHAREIKEKFFVKEIGIFGSQIKARAKKRSDIDILVEFEARGETFDNYMELKFFLEKIFNKRVDLVLKDVLKEEIKEAILADVVYV